MKRARATHYGALKRRIARLTASLRSVFERCVTAWSNARFAVSARRNAGRARASFWCEHGARAWRITPLQRG
eukprot:3049687-Lingulodinium_polyedra.AAC.1